MPFSVSPAVFVREVDATAGIPALSTAPAAIVGVFEWGPVNERILITSEAHLVSRFGKPSDSNAETFFTAADYLAYSNALYVTRVEDSANTASSVHFDGKYPGKLGSSVEVSYVTRTDYENLFIGENVLEGTLTFGSNRIQFETTESNDVVFEPNDIFRIGNENVGYQDLVISEVTMTSDSEANTSVTTYSYDFLFEGSFSLSELELRNMSILKRWGYSGFTENAPTVDNIHIAVIDRGGKITGVPGTLLELYENISTIEEAKLEDGSNNYYPTVLENKSNWIVASDTIINASIADTGYELLEGGADGNNEANVSFGKIAQGYDLYRDPSDVDISFILQGKGTTALDNTGLPVHANVANYIISNVVEERKDCVAFISPPKEAVVDPANPTTKLNRIIAYRNAMQSSSYWFMDSGYKYRYDKYNDVYRWIPLNGDMAGLASRIDPWASPAGYKRGIIKNVVKLAFSPNKAQRDLLYGSSINPVISEAGQGVLLFGDKTGQGYTSAFDRINVRRLFITIEKAIATAARSFLFDFNDEFTRTQFRNMIEPYLRDIQGRRGIIDFRVITDSSVNTPDVIDAQKFRANIFIKPARTINYIELTFVATKTGVAFEEIIGQPL